MKKPVVRLSYAYLPRTAPCYRPCGLGHLPGDVDIFTNIKKAPLKALFSTDHKPNISLAMDPSLGCDSIQGDDGRFVHEKARLKRAFEMGWPCRSKARLDLDSSPARRSGRGKRRSFEQL